MRELRRKPKRCRTRYLWWGYVKNCIRAYPDRRRQMEAGDVPTGHMRSDTSLGLPRPTERQAILNLCLKKQWHLEYDGVRLAIVETEKLPDGQDRISLIDMIFWKGTHTIQGAALQCHVSERTARRWHGAFISLTAVHMGLLDRMETNPESEHS